MNQRIQNFLGVAAIASLLMIGIAALNYSNNYGQSIQPSSFRSFSVTGEGKAIGIPDIAAFTFGIVTEGDKDIAKLQTDNTTKVNAAINFLKSSGVEAKDIKTEAYDLQPRYQYYNCYGADSSGKPCPPATIVGYTITNTVSVKVRKFEKVGEIVAGVTNAGANNVSSLNFTIDDSSALQDQARAEAIAKAKAKAKSIAKAGGFGLGRLLSIEENSNNYYPIYSFEAVSKDSAPSVAPTIEPGSKDITVTVTLRYEIE